jgi:adenylate cyclase
MSSENQNTHHSRLIKPKYSIKLKLLLIISSILLASVLTIIFLASYFFKRDGQIRIEENTLEVVSISSNNITAKFLSLSKNMKLISESLIEKDSEEFKKIFFENESDVIFLGIFKLKDDELIETKRIQNKVTQSENIVSDEEFQKSLNVYKEDIKNSFSGASVLRNVNSSFNSPFLIYSIPFKEMGNEKTIIVALLKLNNILESFQNIGITTTFLVDEKGNLLAHPNVDDVVKNINISNQTIFKSLETTKLNTAQFIRYQLEGITFLGSYKKLGFAGGGVISTVAEDKALEAVYDIQRRNIYLMISTLMFAILVIFLFANTITKPILNLVDMSHEIESGNYHVHLHIPSRDEIGVLTQSFNSMSKGLDEREKMKDAFGKFVNKELADMAMKGEIKLGGERKYCAIFFSDIRSFTSISEKLQPEEVVEFLNAYMTEMVHCVENTNGIVDKFIGDAIMATWGALKNDPNCVENAINGSLMMRAALLKFNKGRGGDKKPIIKIGCGINSGFVISGQIGSEQRLEYTVIGDAVNLASRIEALNKPFGSDILISEEAYQQVKNIFNVEKMQSIKVKGKEEAQTIFAVLGRKDDPNCYKNMTELREHLGIEYSAPEPTSKTKGKKKSKKNSGDEEEKEVKYEILE